MILTPLVSRDDENPPLLICLWESRSNRGATSVKHLLGAITLGRWHRPFACSILADGTNQRCRLAPRARDVRRGSDHAVGMRGHHVVNPLREKTDTSESSGDARASWTLDDRNAGSGRTGTAGGPGARGGERHLPDRCARARWVLSDP